MIKYKSKHKFVNRGVYFVSQGEYKGSFVMNVKECDIGDNKALLLLPDNIPISMMREDVEKLFENSHFAYVKTIPKRIYKVCVAEYAHRRVNNDPSN